MKVRHLFSAAAMVTVSLIGTVASAATIEVIETFDFPGTGRNTEPQKINNRGDIVGAVIDPAAGVTRGFYRGRDGTFSASFAEPNDTGSSTQGRGINDSREICGNYTNGADSTIHGFFLATHVFSEFDLPGKSSTLLLGINNAGDVAGSEIESDGVTQNGFVSVGGTVTTFAVPGASATLAYQINASNQSAGYYVDADGVTLHGYLRDSDGTLTFPIDPDGSTGTILFGNNDSNWAVGRYTDADGITHGLFFTAPGDYVSFDFPGSTFTSFNGINQQGYICGRYVDDSGIEHGILAKVHLDGTSEPQKNNTLPATVIRPVMASPRGLGLGAPAML
ncbi:MAG TPA: hypothetical protein VGL24_13840 [Chthoniobacterales bacterium]|jgi:hypothetical protein